MDGWSQPIRPLDAPDGDHASRRPGASHGRLCWLGLTAATVVVGVQPEVIVLSRPPLGSKHLRRQNPEGREAAHDIVSDQNRETFLGDHFPLLEASLSRPLMRGPSGRARQSQRGPALRRLPPRYLRRGLDTRHRRHVAERQHCDVPANRHERSPFYRETARHVHVIPSFQTHETRS
jgi:hypothetical protein